MYTPNSAAGHTVGEYSNNVSSKPTTENDSGEKQQRKRMRVPTSCSVCRRRKIKCDKAKPVCSECNKSNVQHLCHYEEPSWVSNDDTKRAKPAAATPAAATSPFAQAGITNMPFDIKSLPPQAKQVFDELLARVKHLEASIAVHDLSKSSPSSTTPPQAQQDLNPVLPPLSKFIQPKRNGSSRKDSRQADTPAYSIELAETINFFDYFPLILKKNRVENYGPFSVVAAMRKDIYLKILWVQLWQIIELTSNRLDSAKNVDLDGSRKTNCIAEVLKSDTKGSHELSRFLELKRMKTEEKSHIALLFADKNIKLDDLILSVLPNKKVIMLLCFRFFKYVYPFFPFIEENSFFSEIDTIIGPLGFNEANITKLNITAKNDYATVGLLLVVLRFAFITITPKEFVENDDLRSLLETPVGARVIFVARKCIEEYQILKKSYSLRLFQTMLYYMMYFRHCFEDDETSVGADSQIGLGTLFSIGYSMGLNRNPDIVPAVTASAKTKAHAQLWRKVWNTLLDLDATKATTSSARLNCPDDHDSDCPLPFVDPLDDDVDTFVNNDFIFLRKKTELLREVSLLCSNLQDNPRVVEVERLVRKIETFVATNLGTIEDIFSDPSLADYAVVKKISYYIELQSLIISINNHLLQHFTMTKNSRQSYQYTEKCLDGVVKLSNTLMNIAYNEELYFKPGYAFYLRPLTKLAASRASLFYLSMLSKTLQAQQKISGLNDHQRTKALHDFGEVLFQRMENVLQLLSKISANYYNFSRIFMALRMFYLILRAPAFSFTKTTEDLFTHLESSQFKLQLHCLNDIKREDIPKSNLLMELLDPEIVYLSSRAQADLFQVLQSYSRNRNYKPSARASGAPERSQSSSISVPADSTARSTSSSYYDPISGKTVVNPLSTSEGTALSGVSPQTASDINIDNIFGTQDEFQKFSNDNFGIRTAITNDSLTSEEYASFFGIFDDYNGFFGNENFAL